MSTCTNLLSGGRHVVLERHEAQACKLCGLVFTQVLMIRNGREIVLGGGNIHCITQQQPAGSSFQSLDITRAHLEKLYRKKSADIPGKV